MKEKNRQAVGILVFDLFGVFVTIPCQEKKAAVDDVLMNDLGLVSCHSL